MATTPHISDPTIAVVGGTGRTGRRVADGARTGVLIAAIITTGLTAGIYVDWSNAIMPGLHDVDDRTFVATFQALDAATTSPLFIGVGFMGSLSLIVASVLLQLRAERRTVLIFVGVALACWLLMFAITFTVHEPLNQDLRTADGLDSDADFASARALLDEAKWTAWNTVRALVSTIAFGSPSEHWRCRPDAPTPPVRVTW